MPPSLSRSKSLGSIRKTPRLAELQIKQLKNKEAVEFLDAILDMHKEELKESENKKIIASKKDDAVEPLNNPIFIRQPYNIIVPNTSLSGTFRVSTATFLDILNWEGKTTGIPYPGVLSPPTSTLGIRKPFDDFNDVLKKDQGIKGEAVTLVSNTAGICKLSRSKDYAIESHRQGKRILQKNYQHMCFYCGRQIDTKDPGSPIPTLINTQCDHIFPIASALISLKRDANLIYNFQAVHKSCNSHASAMSIDTIWNKIGTDEFTKLNPSRQWCVFVRDGLPTTTQVNTQEWCRGYLSLLLGKLTLVDSQEQMYRKLIFEKVIRSYQTYKDEVRLLMQDDVAQGVQYLRALSTGGSQSFGAPKNNVELLSIRKLKGDEKKYEAFFLDNGKQKVQKFGAEGMSDYTKHKNIDRRNSYISRHSRDLNTRDPTRAGYLSMFILWNKPSLKDSIDDYKTRLKIYNKTGHFPVSIKGYSKKNNFGTPTNVVNKKLYEKVKEQIKSSIKGRRWGAYDSGRLVQMYKQLGGKYSGTKKETPLQRWYKEKWVNACKWPQVVPCGRSDMSNKMAYCRPSVKVTKDTPKTVQSLAQSQINKRCAIKGKTPLVRISGKLKV